MITRVRHNQLDDAQYFSVSEAITVPLLTEDKAAEGREKVFVKGGRFHGFPAEIDIMKLVDGEMVPYGQMTGFIVEDKDGIFAIPATLIEVPEDGKSFGSEIDKVVSELTHTGVKATEEAKKTLEELKSDVDKFNPERTLGFSYKQLLVIGIVGLVVIKLAK